MNLKLFRAFTIHLGQNPRSGNMSARPAGASCGTREAVRLSTASSSPASAALNSLAAASSSTSAAAAAAAAAPVLAPTAAASTKPTDSQPTPETAAVNEAVSPPPSLRNWVSADGSTGFPAESGRYHLYVSLACPWASRCFAVLKAKGLDDVIGVTVTRPVWEKTRPGEPHTGWAFAAEGEEGGGEVDHLNGARFVRDLYDLVHPGYTKFSVPVLWDKVRRTIVNNESADIMRMLNVEFNEFAKNRTLDLYPQSLRSEIDDVNEWVLKSINSGVYRCGSATTQQEYEKAFDEVFQALDKCEDILSRQRYIAGSVLTEADIRLFVSLIRFDEAYFVYFRCNKKLIREYPNLFNYLKDIYQTAGIGETVDMWHIKQYHFRSHPEKNPSGIVPKGLAIDYSSPHNRSKLSKL